MPIFKVTFKIEETATIYVEAESKALAQAYASDPPEDLRHQLTFYGRDQDRTVVSVAKVSAARRLEDVEDDWKDKIPWGPDDSSHLTVEDVIGVRKKK